MVTERVALRRSLRRPGPASLSRTQRDAEGYAVRVVSRDHQPKKIDRDAG